MKDDLEDFIKSNRVGFDLKTPDPKVLNRILVQMDNHDQRKPKGVLIPFRVLQWAAALVVMVLGGTVVILTEQKHAVRSAAIKQEVSLSPLAIKPDKDLRSRTSALENSKPKKRQSLGAVDADLRARKKKLFGQFFPKVSKEEIMLAPLHNMESPASRVTAASNAGDLNNADHDVVDALVLAMNNDPNANVRLAALDGLARFYKEVYVRKNLIISLKRQQDPVVQIALIELLTRMKESAILGELDNLVNDSNTMRAVKDCAYAGIYQLRPSI